MLSALIEMVKVSGGVSGQRVQTMLSNHAENPTRDRGVLVTFVPNDLQPF